MTQRPGKPIPSPALTEQIGTRFRKAVRVTRYYFYLWDEDFGSAFVKVCAYFPYPAKVWVNGHEWVKQQAVKAASGSPSWHHAYGLKGERGAGLHGHHDPDDQ